MTDKPYTVAVVGLGYFSQLHLSAWHANPGVDLVGVTDLDADATRAASDRFGVTGFETLSELIEQTDPDIVDIVAPPQAHAVLIRTALRPGRTIICQKPFCTSLAEAEIVAAEAETTETTLVIHENFRFQPWYRDIKRFLDQGQMGQIYQCRFDLRPGDGRGPDAYLDRQPAFQAMPRLLIHETGVHFIDLFRWLFGDITSVYADLRQLNPAIAGEDAGTMLLSHRGSVQSVFDGNRLADRPAKQPRLTMGEMRIEGEAGSLFLNGEGVVHFRPFGETNSHVLSPATPFDPQAFGGGCVAALIAHVVESLQNSTLPENTAATYLDVIRASDAAYRSHQEQRKIDLTQ